MSFSSGVIVLSGTTLVSGPVGATENTVLAGQSELVLSGGVVLSATDSGGITVYSGGTTTDTSVEQSAYEIVSSGGIARSTYVGLGGSQEVVSGGTASDTIVEISGTEYVYAGGTTTDTTVDSGGLEYVDRVRPLPPKSSRAAWRMWSAAASPR